MRITEKENFVFVRVLSKYLTKRAELHLYGSYVDDRATDGSIDLLLVVHTDEERALIEAQKEQIEREMLEQVEDDDIKLLVVSEEKAQKDQEIRNILPAAVFLYRW